MEAAAGSISWEFSDVTWAAENCNRQPVHTVERECEMAVGSHGRMRRSDDTTGSSSNVAPRPQQSFHVPTRLVQASVARQARVRGPLNYDAGKAIAEPEDGADSSAAIKELPFKATLANTAPSKAA